MVPTFITEHPPTPLIVMQEVATEPKDIQTGGIVLSSDRLSSCISQKWYEGGRLGPSPSPLIASRGIAPILGGRGSDIAHFLRSFPRYGKQPLGPSDTWGIRARGQFLDAC